MCDTPDIEISKLFITINNARHLRVNNILCIMTALQQLLSRRTLNIFNFEYKIKCNSWHSIVISPVLKINSQYKTKY